MDENELKARTKLFARRVIHLCSKLPNTVVGRVIAGQLLRAGTSVGANYRAACRGRSKAEFAAKLGTVEEEADECAYWMELIIEEQLMSPARVLPLHDEAEALMKIAASSRLTTMRRLRTECRPDPIANRKSQIANP